MYNDDGEGKVIVLPSFIIIWLSEKSKKRRFTCQINQNN